MGRPEPARGLVIVLDYEVHYELLLASCEEIMARMHEEDEYEDVTREAILMEAETLLREYGEQWWMLTGQEEYGRWAKEEVRTLFREEIQAGTIRRGR